MPHCLFRKATLFRKAALLLLRSLSLGPIRPVVLIGAVVFGTAPFGTAGAADLKGKFVLEGDVPAPVPVVAGQAAGDFPGAKLFYENLVIDPATKAISYITVYVKDDNFPVTPAAEAAAPMQVVVDNKGGRFNPHMSALWVGKQQLFFTNTDPVSHNSFFDLAGANPLLPPGARLAVNVAATKPTPQAITCNIHPWMKAIVVARKHPYVGITGADGTLEIKDLPDGVEIEFQAWHEASGYLDIPAWDKGRFKMTLKAGANDLGEIKVPLAVFDAL
jgi:hypothetical protein